MMQNTLFWITLKVQKVMASTLAMNILLVQLATPSVAPRRLNVKLSIVSFAIAKNSVATLDVPKPTPIGSVPSITCRFGLSLVGGQLEPGQ